MKQEDQRLKTLIASSATALSAWRNTAAAIQLQARAVGWDQRLDASTSRTIYRTLSRLALACERNDLPVEIDRPQVEALMVAMLAQGASRRKLRSALGAVHMFLEVTDSQPELRQWLQREMRLVSRNRWKARNGRRWSEIQDMVERVCATPPTIEAPRAQRRTTIVSRRAPSEKTLRKVLTRSVMKPYAAAAEAAFMDGRLKYPELLAFAAWRNWRQEKGLRGLGTEDEFRAYGGSVNRLDCLTRAIAAITPMSPDLTAIERVRTSRRRELEPLRGRDRCGRKPTISVHESALPASWRDHLEAMRAGKPGPHDVQPPAPAIIHTIAQKLKQFAYECEQAGQSVAFEQSQFKAFVDAMKERKNKQTTIASSLNKIKDFLIYSGLNSEIIIPLTRQISFEIKKNRGTPKKKEIFLAESGLRLIDVANGASAAFDELERALSGEAPPLSTTKRYAIANEVALLAFVMVFAPRLADISELIVGKTAKRETTGWLFDFESHKTGVPFWTPVDERLNVFIDQAILHGTDESFFDLAYNKRLGTPLFVTGALNQPTCYHWATRRFAERFGIGVHIVRDLLQIWAAQEGRSLEEALTICGHRSIRSAQHYASKEAHLIRIRRMQDRLAQRRAI